MGVNLNKPFFLLAILILSSCFNLSFINCHINDNQLGKNSEMFSQIIGPKSSSLSNPIHIDNNWTEAKVAGLCSGLGTYSNPYIIKDLIINSQSAKEGILIENSNAYCVIENCTIFVYGGHFPTGIKINNTSNAKIINNNCSLNYYGLYLDHSNNNTLIKNDVSDRFALSIPDALLLSNGIILEDSNHNLISKNFGKYGEHSAIYILESSHNIIINNEFYLFGTGLVLWGGTYNNISKNSFTNCHEDGLDLDGNDNNISENVMKYNGESGVIIIGNDNFITENVMSNNGKSGIDLFFSDGNFITKNTVNYNNASGIDLSHSSHNTVSQNVIKSNKEYGIYLTQQSNYNVISENHLSGNKICIKESDCWGNTITNNGFCDPHGVLIMNVIFYCVLSLAIITLAIIAIMILVKLHRRKTYES